MVNANSQKQNYQLVLDKVLNRIALMPQKPRLLLHSCCAPCSSYVLEYLQKYFDITVFYYNPNIYPEKEFYKRAEEQKKLAEQIDSGIKVVLTSHSENEFYECVKGLEHEKEGGRRCEKCFELRLSKTCEYAKKHGFDYFTTTLTISPLKNSQILNSIGKKISLQYNVEYLYSDFKKRNGYKRSCELSDIYGLYRQNYCGCVFSAVQNEHNKNTGGGYENE